MIGSSRGIFEQLKSTPLEEHNSTEMQIGGSH